MAYTGFWASYANADGSRMVGSERQLTPAPRHADYPTDALGSLLEPADGTVIQQQPEKDNRRRAWVWVGFPEWHPQYRALYQYLLSLRSRTRREAGLSPFVYLYDSLTKEFLQLVTEMRGVTSATSSTITLNFAYTTGQLAGGSIEITSGTGAGQFRVIQSNTGAVVTPDSAWTTTPDATSQVVVRYQTPQWFKARVLDVARKLDDNSGLVRYDETRLTFTIDDTSWNNIG